MKHTAKLQGVLNHVVAASDKFIRQQGVVKSSYRTFINHRGEVISVGSREELQTYNSDVVLESRDW